MSNQMLAIPIVPTVVEGPSSDDTNDLSFPGAGMCGALRHVIHQGANALGSSFRRTELDRAVLKVLARRHRPQIHEPDRQSRKTLQPPAGSEACRRVFCGARVRGDLRARPMREIVDR